MSQPAGLRALPGSARILHIGPCETGGAGLRRAFDAKVHEAGGRGVRWHAGPDTLAAALALTGEPSAIDGAVPSRVALRGLIGRVEREAGARVLVSEDAFAGADEAAIRAIVGGLGRDSVHVVVTLRPLAAILAGHWQALLLDGHTQPFEAWLEATLAAAGEESDRFWRRHRHDRLVARWAAAVGPERVTAIVDADSQRLFATFETLLGLRSGTLPRRGHAEDRDLTLPEAEVLRTLNVAIGRQGLRDRRASDVRRSVAGQLRRRVPRQDEAAVQLPAAAVARIAAVALDIAVQVARSGVRVVGDPAERSDTPPASAALRGREVSESTWADIGAAAAVGTLIAAGLVPAAESAGVREGVRLGRLPAGGAPAAARVEALELAGTSTPELGRMLLRRGYHSARSRLGRARPAVQREPR